MGDGSERGMAWVRNEKLADGAYWGMLISIRIVNVGEGRHKQGMV